ncbi:MAG: hypothetical protein RLZZ505_2413 [Verrucomicrobiota bacterium]|jgi:hypothetical protein
MPTRLLALISLLTIHAAHANPPASTLPASPSFEERCRSYLKHAARPGRSEPDDRISNKSALLLPGLLASIVEVKDASDPRLARFMAETQRILRGLEKNQTRIGPFEIYFPIANHASAKRLLGPILTGHPGYKEYEKAVFAHQGRWSDYKSNGFGPPRSPIREAKTLADVSGNIDNGNFRLLVTAAGYLSAQEFPEFRTVSKDPKTGKEKVFTRDVILREMDLYLRRTYHSIATRNISEYGAQTYLAIDFAPIRLIAESAHDPEIRRIAAGALDCLHSSLAASMNQGHYINSAARSKGEFLGTGSAIGFIGWLAFGSDKPSRADTVPFTVYYALPGTYRLPPVIRPHTEFPFVKRERIDQGGNFVTVYTYQSRSFGMTSSIESRGAAKRTKAGWDRDSFFKEAGRHKLNWFGAKPGGFSPQWENSLQPYAARRNQRNARYYGTNPWSYVKQYRGTQIGLADVNEGYPFRQVYSSYPMDSLRARIVKPDTGWTLCHTGNVVFAFRSLKPPTKAADPWPNKSFLTDWYDYKKTAWILEAVEAPGNGAAKTDGEISKELENFHQTLLRAKVTVANLDDAETKPPTLSYTSPIHGKTLTLDASVYPVPTDGEGMEVAKYPLLATYPEKPGAPRVIQEKDELRWLDGTGKTAFELTFADWLK